MNLPLNLSAIATLALVLSLTACSGESDADADVKAEPSENKPRVEAKATNGVDDAPNAGNEAASDAFVIVMLGDSLTAGYGLSDIEAPPAQIEKRLRDGGLAVKIINAGVSGDTTAGGLARFDWSVASATPDLLVVALGANDYLGGVAPVRTKANLEAIIKRAKREGVPVALVGIAPRSTAKADARGAEFGAIYADLAAAYDTPLFPAMLNGVRDNPDLLQSDGLHPSAEGVSVIADNLAGFLAPIVATREE